MAMLEFHTRRAVRDLITAALEKTNSTLQQNTIENMCTIRIIELAKENALGIRDPVDWEVRVAAAVAGEAKDKADYQALANKHSARAPVIKLEE